MWAILNEFVLTWEENTNQDAFELYDNILKIVETEFNVMISEMDQEDLTDIISDYNNNIEEFKKCWIEEEAKKLMKLEEQTIDEMLYIEITRGNAFYDFDNLEDMEDILEEAKAIRKSM